MREIPGWIVFSIASWRRAAHALCPIAFPLWRHNIGRWLGVNTLVDIWLRHGSGDWRPGHLPQTHQRRHLGKDRELCRFQHPGWCGETEEKWAFLSGQQLFTQKPKC